MRQAQTETSCSARGKSELAGSLRLFARMYRPHAAREDTVLIPALGSLAGHAARREMAERFEERQHLVLGGRGFPSAVAEVTALEKALGLSDISQYTVPQCG